MTTDTGNMGFVDYLLLSHLTKQTNDKHKPWVARRLLESHGTGVVGNQASPESREDGEWEEGSSIR